MRVRCKDRGFCTLNRGEGAGHLQTCHPVPHEVFQRRTMLSPLWVEGLTQGAEKMGARGGWKQHGPTRNWMSTCSQVAEFDFPIHLPGLSLTPFLQLAMLPRTLNPKP